MLRANFTFQNAAEIELERGKKTEKFILIITLKAYTLTGTIFARSRICRETRKVCGSITSTLRYRFREIRGVRTIGDFYRKIRGRITVASTVLHQ